MKPLVSPLIGAAFFCAISILHAQQDAPAIDPNVILQTLKKVEDGSKNAVYSTRQNAINILNSSSGQGASALYEKAVEQIQFAGMPNAAAAIGEWRQNNGDVLRSHPMQDMLALHFRYLILSLQRAASDKPAQFIDLSLNYASELANVDAELPVASDKQDSGKGLGMGKQDRGPVDRATQINRLTLQAKKQLLNSSLADSVVAKYLGVDSMLPEGKDWELKPGDLSGIMEKNIRTGLRTLKSPKLLDTWMIEMRFLAARATNEKFNSSADDFNTVVRPQEMFGQANDMILLGQKYRGINQILVLVKTYPQHPDFKTWADRLRELAKELQAPAAAPAAAAAPEASTAPAENTAPQ